MPRAVVLLHELQDGTSHYDWLVEDLCIVGEHRLRAWRMDGVPGRAGCWRGARIGLHRAMYLDFEGEIGGGRGHVRRVLRGEVLSLELGQRSVEASVQWGENGPVCTIRGSAVAGRDPSDPEIWEFTVIEDQGSRGG